MSSEFLIPIIASFLTLVVTKLFDAFMASRKDRMDSVIQSLSAVDEITTAASDTITYLRKERDEAREERRQAATERDKAIGERNAVIDERDLCKKAVTKSLDENLQLNKRIEELLVEINNKHFKDC